MRPRPIAWLALLAMPFTAAFASTLPEGFTETRLATGLDPSAMAFAPDGRLFICEKNGRIRVVKNGMLLAAPFATVDADAFNERGLLGLAFDPRFPSNRFLYVFYTAKDPAHNRVSRFTAAGDAAEGPETIILELDNLSAQGTHNGGALLFGKDGKLYVASGNNHNNDNSQSLGNLLGKILRLNPDGSIPGDNPFSATATGKARAIWALGLRNPFTMDVHPVSGRILINDVGETVWEEIDEGAAGANYGWPLAEGHAATTPTGLEGAYRDPLASYRHNGSSAIAGGAFYPPDAASFGPGYAGGYFFADYNGGWIRFLDAAHGNAVSEFATGILRPIALRVGPDGDLYYLTRGKSATGVAPGSLADNGSTGDGQLFRIRGPRSTALADGYPRCGETSAKTDGSPRARRGILFSPRGKRGSGWIDLSGKAAAAERPGP